MTKLIRDKIVPLKNSLAIISPSHASVSARLETSVKPLWQVNPNAIILLPTGWKMQNPKMPEMRGSSLALINDHYQSWLLYFFSFSFFFFIFIYVLWIGVRISWPPHTVSFPIHVKLPLSYRIVLSNTFIINISCGFNYYFLLQTMFTTRHVAT